MCICCINVVIIKPGFEFKVTHKQIYNYVQG